MAKRPWILPRLPLLLLVCSSCAWVGCAAAIVDGSGPGPVPGNERVAGDGGAGGAEPLWRRISGELEGNRLPSAAEPAHVVRDGCRAMITPPPSLSRRQDQGQIQALSNQLQQLSAQSRSVSQASQQLSQSSQQLSQSLQQFSQRLSQTEQQLASARLQQNAAESASRSMSQAAAEASRRADEARASADRSISEVMRSASQSASQAISENMASLTSSMGASFSSAISAASQSAAAVMRSAASRVQQAQADATALRVSGRWFLLHRREVTNLSQNEANTQLQQAQGAALSVTQTALAVVGGIIGSSLLTIACFLLILRHRRKKRRQARHSRGGSVDSSEKPIIGYPNVAGDSRSIASKKEYAASDNGSSSSSTYSTDDSGFRFPPGSADNVTKPPPASVAVPVRANTVTISRKNVGPGIGVGYALSYYGPRVPAGPVRPSMSMSTTNRPGPGDTFQLGNPPPPRAAGKFSLFPKPTDREKEMEEETGSWTSMSAAGAEESKGPPKRVSNPSPLTLDKWLRDGTAESPFSTMKEAAGR